MTIVSLTRSQNRFEACVCDDARGTYSFVDAEDLSRVLNSTVTRVVEILSPETETSVRNEGASLVDPNAQWTIMNRDERPTNETAREALLDAVREAFAGPEDEDEEEGEDRCRPLTQVSTDDVDVSDELLVWIMPYDDVYFTSPEGREWFRSRLLAGRPEESGPLTPAVATAALPSASATFPKNAKLKRCMDSPAPRCTIATLQKMCLYVCDFIRALTAISKWMSLVSSDALGRIDAESILAKYPRYVLDHAAKPKTTSGYALPIDGGSNDFTLFREWSKHVSATIELRRGVDWRILGRHDFYRCVARGGTLPERRDGTLSLAGFAYVGCGSIGAVPITLSFDTTKSVVFVTGPNEIGKTTAIRAAMCASLMGRAGLPTIGRVVYTHFESLVRNVDARSERSTLSFHDDDDGFVERYSEVEGDATVHVVVVHDADVIRREESSKRVQLQTMTRRGEMVGDVDPWRPESVKRSRIHTVTAGVF